MKGKFTRAEFDGMASVKTCVIITGREVSSVYARSGTWALVEGYLVSPRQFRVDIRDFTSETVKEEYCSKLKRYVSIVAPSDEVLVLGDDAACDFLGRVEKVRRLSENYSVGEDGVVRFNGTESMYGAKIKNACLFNIPKSSADLTAVKLGDNPLEWKTEWVCETPSDALEKICGREHLYFHTNKGMGIKYVLDIGDLMYWRLRSLPPGPCRSQPPYLQTTRTSREVVGYLLNNEGLNADLMLNCEISWQNDCNMLEICRRELDGCGKVRSRYNFFHTGTGFISGMWFDGTSDDISDNMFQRFAYLLVNNGRQWYRVTFAGKVEKCFFEHIKIRI